MTDQKLDALHAILTEVDALLRNRLKELGVADLAHILVVVAPSGATLVHGNVEPEGLKALAQDLSEAADEAMNRPPNEEPIH